MAGYQQYLMLKLGSEFTVEIEVPDDKPVSYPDVKNALVGFKIF